jgi:hypothetical protein
MPAISPQSVPPEARRRVGLALLGFNTVAGRRLQHCGFIALIGIHQPD